MNISSVLKKRIQRSRWRRFWRRGMESVALVVVFCTAYMLILPAITITAKCGYEEHSHTVSCYDEAGELTCERIAHEHTPDCFMEEQEAEEETAPLDEENAAAPVDETEAPVDEAENDEDAPTADAEQEEEPQDVDDSEAIGAVAEEDQLSETVESELLDEEPEEAYLIEDSNVTISLPNSEEGIQASIMAVRNDSTEFNDLQNAMTIKLGADELGLEMLHAYQITLTDLEGEELTLENGVQVELTFETPIEAVSEDSDWAFYSGENNNNELLNEPLKDITQEEKTEIAVNEGSSITSFRYNAAGSGELLLVETSAQIFDEELVEEAEEESGIASFTGTYEDISVIATCESGVLPSDAALTITPVDANNEAISAAMELECERSGKLLLVENAYSFDLTFTNRDGEEIEPTGFVNVEMSFGSHLDVVGNHLLLIHKKTPIEADISTVNENQVTAVQFSVDSFSDFTLVDSSEIEYDSAAAEAWVDADNGRSASLSVGNYTPKTGGYFYYLGFEAPEGIYLSSSSDTSNGMSFYYELPFSLLDSRIDQSEDKVISRFFGNGDTFVLCDDKGNPCYDDDGNLCQFHLRIVEDESAGKYIFQMTFPERAVYWAWPTFMLGFWSAGQGSEDVSGVLEGSATRPVLYARKVDANNPNLRLNGAEYAVYYATKSDPSLVKLNPTYVSGVCTRPASCSIGDHTGYIEINYDSSNKSGINLLSSSTAYCLQESSAPVGYNIDPMRHWFYLIDTSRTDLTANTKPATMMQIIQEAEQKLGGVEGEDYDVTRLIGYKDDSGIYYISTMTLIDTPGYTLPNTGGMGINLYTYAGVLLFCGAALILYKKHCFLFKRREMK